MTKMMEHGNAVPRAIGNDSQRWSLFYYALRTGTTYVQAALAYWFTPMEKELDQPAGGARLHTACDRVGC